MGHQERLGGEQDPGHQRRHRPGPPPGQGHEQPDQQGLRLRRQEVREAEVLRWAEAYEALKRELAVRHASDVEAYAVAKSDFVHSILRPT